VYVEQAADAVVFDELIEERVALREEGGLQLHHEPLGDPPTQSVHPIQRVVLLYHTHSSGHTTADSRFIRGRGSYRLLLKGNGLV
jgi:hypothetical protein